MYVARTTGNTRSKAPFTKARAIDAPDTATSTAIGHRRRTAKTAEPPTSSTYASGATGPRAGSLEACSPTTAPTTDPIAIVAASSESQISGSTRRRRSQKVVRSTPRR